MNDLKLIKKYYGEKMMHLCRELFPTLLEKEGLLFNLLESNFAHSKFLYDDIVNRKVNFKDYIYSLVDVEKKEIEVLKTPKELLDEAGYILYECKTEEDIQNFKKYYTKNEELCTFNGGRLNNCYVFFAVKKNVDDIKRENFKNPNRQDEYGTSVISIQFSRGEVNTLSIKNRYNHTVNNPDATFSNNLENIISGLTSSFERVYDLNINQNSQNKFELYGYVKANDKKIYKYNYEINNIYYCPDNIIIDNFEVIKDYQEKEKYIVLDYFILDLVNKQVKLYDQRIEDSFIDWFLDIKKIDVTKISDNNKLITIILNNSNTAYIEIDKYNKIINYHNKFITKIGNSFLGRIKSIKIIDLPNVVSIEDNFLHFNYSLQRINMPKLQIIGYDFLSYNDSLTEISLPNVLEIGSDFLDGNGTLEKINLPNVRKIGNRFLLENNSLKNLFLPNVIKIDDVFLGKNKNLEELDLPNVVSIGYGFLRDNKNLKKINIPKIEKIGDSFLILNKSLKEINIPKTKIIGNNFLGTNTLITKIDLPNVELIESNFLSDNVELKKVNLPNVKIIYDNFLSNNEFLEELDLPNLEEVGDCFLYSNIMLEKVKMPRIEIIGDNFLFYNNKKIKEIELPNLVSIGNYFLHNNDQIEKLSLPNVKQIGSGFLYWNCLLEEINLPNIEKVGLGFLTYSKSLQKELILKKKI